MADAAHILGTEVGSAAPLFLAVLAVHVLAGLTAVLTGAQGSGVLSSCVAADGLAIVPAQLTALPTGAEVEVLLLREDLGWVR